MVSGNNAKLEKARVDVTLINFARIWNLFIVNWQWFIVSIIACVLIAGVYLWFTPGTVSVAGKMEIIDKSKKSGGLSAGMAMLNSLPMGLGSAIGGSIGGSAGIDSEKEILKSTILVRNVVNDMGVYTEYRLCKWGRKTLLYKDQPINVSIDAAHLQWFDSELPLTSHKILLTISKNDEGYSVETVLKENKKKTSLPSQTFATLPATIKTEAGTLTLTANTLTEKQSKAYSGGYTLDVTIAPPTEVANDFISRLTADPPSKKVTNMLKITLRDQNLMRGIDFVNHLVDAYNQRANDEKNEEARKTDEFVNNRLAKIDGELGSSDAAWENSKKNFQITDPSVDAEEVITKKSLYENKLVEIGTELQLHDYLSEYVHNPENMYELIPVGFAGGMGNLSGEANGKESTSSNASLIAQHNTLVSQRKELLRSMSDKAPQIQRLTESIKELHPSLLTALKRDRQNIIMKRSAVEREYSKYMGRINMAPKMERVLTEIGRQREIKQGVYLLMLQKREETAMDLANTTDKGRLIDDIYVVNGSSKPQKMIVLVIAFFLGAILPLGILYLTQMLKTKIDTPNDLKGFEHIPLIGEIELGQNEESLRTLRTNLMLNMNPDEKVIMLVSNIDGDGKTYLAKHLVDSLSTIGKKVQLMDLDMRSNSNGMNPADYFASSEFSKKMAEARENNEYVIIDTPSFGLYNDACQLAPFSDITLFVIKVGSTEKAVIDKIQKKAFPKLMFVLNSIDLSKRKYKYQYKKG